jgi:DNA-binding response OmpR family regulator
VRVLVVEDATRLATAIARVLRRSGIATDVAHDGETALQKAGREAHDVIVLDRNLPALSGDDVCRRLVAEGTEIKILMLTPRDAIGERVAGLELGADDYVPKPVAMTELVARVRALPRRRGMGRAAVLRFGDITLDQARRRTTRDGRVVGLATKEFAILEELMLADGAVVSADRLLSRVWDESYREPFENTVRVTIMRLRRKLGEPRPIETVVGSGYRLR